MSVPYLADSDLSLHHGDALEVPEPDFGPDPEPDPTRPSSEPERKRSNRMASSRPCRTKQRPVPTPKRARRCAYCGTPTSGARACKTHRDLLKHDPHYTTTAA